MQIITIIILVFIALAVLIAFYVLVFGRRKRVTETDQKYIRDQWRRIIGESREHPNAAILEADKLLAHTLELYGYQGSLGEKLKVADTLFSHIDDVWKAHKMRNKIAHEIGMRVRDEECRITLNRFRSALKDLGIKFK